MYFKTLEYTSHGDTRASAFSSLCGLPLPTEVAHICPVGNMGHCVLQASHTLPPSSTSHCTRPATRPLPALWPPPLSVSCRGTELSPLATLCAEPFALR